VEFPLKVDNTIANTVILNWAIFFYHILVLVGAYKKIGTGSRVIFLIFSEFDCHRKQNTSCRAAKC
jgi:hypothetical protein